jgi:hypothetical protein
MQSQFVPAISKVGLQRREVEQGQNK